MNSSPPPLPFYIYRSIYACLGVQNPTSHFCMVNSSPFIENFLNFSSVEKSDLHAVSHVTVHVPFGKLLLIHSRALVVQLPET